MHKAESIFVEEMPLTPLFHWSCAYIAKPYVKSFDLAPLGNGFFEKIYIDRKN
jgi:oligopeptide transport system substrate-binding protein